MLDASSSSCVRMVGVPTVTVLTRLRTVRVTNDKTSQTSLTRINEWTNCSQTGQDCPETFIERAL